MKQRIVCLLLVLLAFASCNKNTQRPPETPDRVPVPPASTFAKGADVSWLTEMEAAGKKFYNVNGSPEDLFAILKMWG